MEKAEWRLVLSPDGGSWLYFGKDGKIVTAKWMSINGKTYYFDEDGLMQTGLLELDGQTYYLGEEDDGARKTGWILLETITKDTDDEDIWCYFDTEGPSSTARCRQAGSMSRKLAL